VLGILIKQITGHHLFSAWKA